MKRCPTCQTVYTFDYTHCPRDGNTLIEAGEWTEGTLVRGKYQILAKVGQGGMGSVYRAMHTRFKEVRALKVISPELASDATFVRRFEQEAVITRKLQHPNAVRIEDIDQAEDGRPFIVMEFIEGRSLKDVIEQEAPMAVERVCSITKQVAAVLDAAHTLGLIHRDIKPANIALVRSANESGTQSEQVKVLDFGIAKLKEAHLEDSKAHLSHMTLTGTGVVVGTPAYMSPEQAKGLKSEQLDGRSDLYSLGIVMYQMLTGELPLKADSTIEQLMAHINTPPKAIQNVRPDLKIPVARAVMRCLEKNRELRPATGLAMIGEIEAETRLAAYWFPRELPSEATYSNLAGSSPLFPDTSITPRTGMTRSSWRYWIPISTVIAGAALVAWYLQEAPNPTVPANRVPLVPEPSKVTDQNFQSLTPSTPRSLAAGRRPETPRTQTVVGRMPPNLAKPSSRNDSSTGSGDLSANVVKMAESTSAGAASTGPHGSASDDSGSVQLPSLTTASLKIVTNPPVPGAKVLFDGEPWGVTDAAGHLEVPHVLRGRHSVTVSKEGYLTIAHDLNLDADENTDVLPMSLNRLPLVFAGSIRTSEKPIGSDLQDSSSKINSFELLHFHWGDVTFKHGHGIPEGVSYRP